MAKMKPSEFVKAYYPYAKQTEEKTGIDARFTLAQAALETGWGASAPGNMFFGIKDTDGINGNEQLLRTREILRTPNAKFPVIISIVQKAKGLWQYIVKDWFRKYDTPEGSFTDHAQFFFKNKRYSKALEVKHDPYLFADEVAAADYATDPDYAAVLKSIIQTIEKNIEE